MQDRNKPITDLRGLNLPNMNLAQANSITIEQLAACRQKSSTSGSEAEFNRLLAAAVINLKFRQLLLSNAALAIEAGFQREKFHFSESQRQLILSIKARSLEEFAEQLIALLRY